MSENKVDGPVKFPRRIKVRTGKVAADDTCELRGSSQLAGLYGDSFEKHLEEVFECQHPDVQDVLSKAMSFAEVSFSDQKVPMRHARALQIVRAFESADGAPTGSAQEYGFRPLAKVDIDEALYWGARNLIAVNDYLLAWVAQNPVDTFRFAVRVGEVMTRFDVFTTHSIRHNTAVANEPNIARVAERQAELSALPSITRADYPALATKYAISRKTLIRDLKAINRFHK